MKTVFKAVLLSIIMLLLSVRLTQGEINHDHLPNDVTESSQVIGVEPISPQNGTYTNRRILKFNWTEAENSEGIEYQSIVEVIKQKIGSATKYYKSPWLSRNRYRISNLPEGDYRWYVKSRYRDKPEQEYTTEALYFTVDRTPPVNPILSPLPEKSFTDQIQLFIENYHELIDSGAATLNVKSSASEEASEIIGRNFEIAEELTLDISDFAGGTVYIEISAVDRAENYSLEPDTVTTHLVKTPSKVEPPTLSEKYISPYSSRGVKDTVTINIPATEEEFDTRSIKIVNHQEEVIYSKVLDNSESSVVWPESKDGDLQDGRYIVYLEATFRDEALTSPVRYLVIDNSSPNNPNCSRYSKSKYTRKRTHTVKLNNKYRYKAQISINKQNVLTSNSKKISKKLTFKKDGEFRVKLSKTDRAGNSSYCSFIKVLDRVPPKKPKIELSKNIDNKSLSLLIKSKKHDQGKIFSAKGHYIKSFTDKRRKVLLVKPWVQGSTYSYYVYTYDKAGNRSPKSRTVKFKAPSEAVLGESISKTKKKYPKVKYSECTFKVNLDMKDESTLDCKWRKPRLVDSSNIHAAKNHYWLNLYGSYNPRVKLKVVYSRCKERTLKDLRTFYTCVEIKDEVRRHTVQTYGSFITKINGKEYSEYINNNKKHRFAIIVNSIHNHKGKKASVKLEHYFSLKLKDGAKLKVNGTTPYSNSIKVPKAIKGYVDKSSKEFRFPYNKYVQVTQWWGKTAYSEHHTGIDYGTSPTKVYAVADGYIESVGWDSYYGKCNSGGNYIKIKHDNGKRSVYMHLSNYKKKNGSKWRKGQRVKKGALVGKTGNTGTYNCQPLGYHLHFEIRKKSAQSTNTDPVPLTDVDWGKILTKDPHLYPGRLTGNNPHPGK